jgi:hypothetical protein
MNLNHSFTLFHEAVSPDGASLGQRIKRQNLARHPAAGSGSSANVLPDACAIGTNGQRLRINSKQHLNHSLTLFHEVVSPDGASLGQRIKRQNLERHSAVGSGSSAHILPDACAVGTNNFTKKR